MSPYPFFATGIPGITISYKKINKTTRHMGFVQVISGAFCGLRAFIGNANKKCGLPHNLAHQELSYPPELISLGTFSIFYNDFYR